MPSLIFMGPVIIKVCGTLGYISTPITQRFANKRLLFFMFLLLVYAFVQQILNLQVNIIYMYTKCIALLPYRSMFMPVNFVILFTRTPKKTQSLQFFAEKVYPNRANFYLLIICEILSSIWWNKKTCIFPAYFLRHIGLFKPCFMACLTISIQFVVKCSLHCYFWTLISRKVDRLGCFLFLPYCLSCPWLQNNRFL